MCPPCYYLGPNYSGGNEDNGDLLQKISCMYFYIQCPQPCSRPPLTHGSTGDSYTVAGKSGSVSCGVTAAFSWVLVHTRFCLCSPRVYFPVLCKFWQLHVGVNGDLLQEGLCHTQACCTQNPHPCGSPLLTCTSTRDAQTQFCLSLCGILRACSLEQPKLKTENAKCWQGCQATVTIKHCLCVKQWLCNGV